MPGIAGIHDYDSALLTIMLLGMIRGKIPWQAHPLHCGFA